MKRGLFLIVLSAFVLYLFSTAGMLFVGMQHENMSGCAGEMCAQSTADTNGNLFCLDHCISSATNQVSAAVFNIIVFSVLVFAARQFLAVFADRRSFFLQHWRSFVSRFLLRQRLSTVIILS